MKTFKARLVSTKHEIMACLSDGINSGERAFKVVFEKPVKYPINTVNASLKRMHVGWRAFKAEDGVIVERSF